MNLIKFASLMAATGGGKNKLSLRNASDPAPDHLECLNEGMDAMCCLHSAGGDSGIEGCITCMMKAFEDYGEEPSCEDLTSGDFCADIESCFVPVDGTAPCGMECVDEIELFGTCSGDEDECKGICEPELGFALPLTIA
eukprot:CAMPEP_0201953984 /NCGR_PEP_ID=MMETSP0904-20121228/2130_1 /ASSEMBLY_ACC=CAM_ASM_000553 /TAXON_ID=420261 /ORGANISM="Thalassiosira antarctica, Strain CCMP982" /LENGTH=138 /DNA_ID=CAMNT_0048497931 /DNA_START=63 /DNA_END=479 /DNA_ORIENTATION=+